MNASNEHMDGKELTMAGSPQVRAYVMEAGWISSSEEISHVSTYVLDDDVKTEWKQKTDDRYH
jgi:hypothetical protein